MTHLLTISYLAADTLIVEASFRGTNDQARGFMQRLYDDHPVESVTLWDSSNFSIVRLSRCRGD